MRAINAENVPLGYIDELCNPPHETPVKQPKKKCCKKKNIEHSLRKSIGKILPYERVSKCGQKPLGTNAYIYINEHNRAKFGGLVSCGSVWHCPICAAKISRERKEEVEEVLKNAIDREKDAFLLTLTIPHTQFQACKMLCEAVSNAWRSGMVNGSPFKRKREEYQIEFVRSLEVTHGGNGWHPHLHIILVTRKLDDYERRNLHAWLFLRWKKYIEKVGLGKISRRHGVDFKKISTEGIKKAGEYVSKWGAASELTQAVFKDGKGGNKSVWKIAYDAQNGCKRSIQIFKEYAAAFKGKRQLTWSRGFRQKYIQAPEKSDADIAASDDENSFELIKIISAKDFYKIVRKDLEIATLEAVEKGGWVEAKRLLYEQGIDIA